jgi:xanthine/uracil/vitamin C permease (AzgA family)
MERGIKMQRYFNFAGHGTSYRQETIAGVTTFLTLAYIIIVNPAILEAAGIPKGASMTATILSAAFGTLVLMSFTFNIGVGMTAGLLSYPLLKALSGRCREVPVALWLLAAMSLSFYIFYPYR